jgi:hypothetical protein
MLFHVSEEPDIDRFEPRPSPSADGLVVWAVDDARLRNYLLPRQCPRVTYYAGPDTAETDVVRFLGPSRAVVAVEIGWLDRIRGCRLFCYELPPQPFTCIDECAGYFVSREAVVPTRVHMFDDLLAALLTRGVELRFVPNLWPLRDAVVASSLRYSMIRMPNALPRLSVNSSTPC